MVVRCQLGFKRTGHMASGLVRTPVSTPAATALIYFVSRRSPGTRRVRTPDPTARSRTNAPTKAIRPKFGRSIRSDHRANILLEHPGGKRCRTGQRASYNFV